MKLNIALVTGGLPFSGKDPEQQSLGGSETALVNMAREFANLGDSVHVYCPCPEPAVYDRVTYFNLDRFHTLVKSMDYDVLISSRWPEFLRSPGRSGLRVLWCHDTLVDKDRFMSGFIQADMCFLLSDFHIKNYEALIPETRDFCNQTRNGIDAELISKVLDLAQDRDPNKYLFTSRPERGLHYLLSDILPKLIEWNPEAKVHFCNYGLGDMSIPEEVQAKIDVSNAWVKKYPEHVVDMGHLSKTELYMEMATAAALLYPTDFPEISCITAIEAQALGLPIVSTNRFALSETVAPGAGVLIDRLPTEPEYASEFMDAVVHVKNNFATCSELGKAWVREKGYVWSVIAEQWHNLFEDKMRDRWNANKSGVIKELIRRNDVKPAAMLAEKHGLSEFSLANVEAARVADKLVALDSPTEESVKSDFENGMKTHDIIRTLLSMQGFVPNRLLDFDATFEQFGIVAKRYWPEASVTLHSGKEMHLQQAHATAKQLEYDISFSQSDALAELIVDCREILGEGVKFDFIYLGDVLDRSPFPQKLLKDLSSLLEPTGYFGIKTRCKGTGQRFKEEKAEWLWDFTCQDLHDIFEETSVFKAVFYESEITPLGDVDGSWVAIAKPCKKYGNIDLERKALTTRPYQSLSTCIIAKDSENEISQTLASVRDIADEIIVVDNSDVLSDEAESIYKKFDVEVVRAEFEHFAQIRNISLDHATSDWILWIDTDERLINADSLRHFIRGGIFNGLALRQVHLTLDNLDKTFDIPVRLLKNKPTYRFVGCIHEHCEDVGKGPYDEPITPSLLVPSVDIAHFGYLNEKLRRQKCSNRNMALLQMDLKVNPGRKLTQVLVIRDCLNIVKWKCGETKYLEPKSEEHAMLETAIDTFHEHFPSVDSHYYALAFPMYQEAVMILGVSGIPYKDNKFPPFEVALTLAGAIGGMGDANLAPTKLWFVDTPSYLECVNSKAVEVVQKLAMIEGEPPELKHSPVYGTVRDAGELLALGTNVIPQ